MVIAKVDATANEVADIDVSLNFFFHLHGKAFHEGKRNSIWGKTFFPLKGKTYMRQNALKGKEQKFFSKERNGF